MSDYANRKRNGSHDWPEIDGTERGKAKCQSKRVSSNAVSEVLVRELERPRSRARAKLARVAASTSRNRKLKGKEPEQRAQVAVSSAKYKSVVPCRETEENEKKAKLHERLA